MQYIAKLAALAAAFSLVGAHTVSFHTMVLCYIGMYTNRIRIDNLLHRQLLCSRPGSCHLLPIRCFGRYRRSYREQHSRLRCHSTSLDWRNLRCLQPECSSSRPIVEHSSLCCHSTGFDRTNLRRLLSRPKPSTIKCSRSKLRWSSHRHHRVDRDRHHHLVRPRGSQLPRRLYSSSSTTC